MEIFDKAEGDISPDMWAMAIVKVSALLIIGIVIISGVVVGSNITESSPFYNMYLSVIQQFNSGYTLAALMVLALGSASILHFLGFI